MNPTVRMATAADREALAWLFHACEVHYLGDEAANTLAEWREHLDATILPAAHACELVIAELDGQPVGLATFAIVYPAADLAGQLFLKELFTADRVRGEGIGRAMMGFLARIARARGCRRIDWVTGRDLPRAMAFYDRLGASRLKGAIYYRLDGPALDALAGEANGQ